MVGHTSTDVAAGLAAGCAPPWSVRRRLAGTGSLGRVARGICQRSGRARSAREHDGPRRREGHPPGRLGRGRPRSWLTSVASRCFRVISYLELQGVRRVVVNRITWRYRFRVPQCLQRPNRDHMRRRTRVTGRKGGEHRGPRGGAFPDALRRHADRRTAGFVGGGPSERARRGDHRGPPAEDVEGKGVAAGPGDRVTGFLEKPGTPVVCGPGSTPGFTCSIPRSSPPCRPANRWTLVDMCSRPRSNVASPSTRHRLPEPVVDLGDRRVWRARAGG